MNAERLKQIEETYHKVLKVSPDERESFLAEFCGEDVELCREVKSLLSFENSSDNLLNSSPESLAAEMLADEKWDDLIGKEIGHFKIKKLLGRGGMGEVYLAEDLKLERLVALKFLPPEFVANEERMNRFIREAKTASALNHPNILTIYEINEFGDTHFIATEFINGKTLNEYVKSNSLNIKSVLEIAIQMASALDEAHSAGIIHRDIKPENIMIRENGLVKILDFGIAKMSEPTAVADDLSLSSETPEKTPTINSNNLRTYPGKIIGTANYMSPEQAEGKEIDARSDIFNFGVVLYEIISGELPFEVGTVKQKIQTNFEIDPKTLENIPAELQRIISKTLKKEREDRYQTTHDLLTDLQKLEQNLNIRNNGAVMIQENKIVSGKTESGEFAKTGNTGLETEDKKATTNSSSLEYAFTQAKSHRLFSAIAAIALFLTFSAITYFVFFENGNSGDSINSIAVMPFINESNDENVEFLSDGMTETLISNLTQIPDLSVKARSSVFYYKEKNVSPKQIGEDLDVDAVLLGRIVRQNDDIKLSLELVDTKTLNALWSKTYDRKFSSVIALQREITKDVSNNLKLQIVGKAEKNIAKTYTTNPKAYEAYLRGRFYWNRRTDESLQKAVRHFKEAIEFDSEYALAYSGLADSYSLLPNYGDISSREAIPKARKAAEKAIELNPDLAEAHASLGYVYKSEWRFKEAENQYRKSIELNPKYATTRHWYGTLLYALERPLESEEQFKIGLELDPLSEVIHRNFGDMYYMWGKYPEAEKQMLKALEINPNSPFSYGRLSEILAQQGKREEAFAAAKKSVKFADKIIESGFRYKELLDASLELHFGSKEKARKLIDQVESGKPGFPVNLAALYTALGEKDKALDKLEMLYKKRYPLEWYLPMREFDALRNEPRFKAMKNGMMNR